MSTEATEARGFLDDRRGAILMAAVFMAVFLVGCLWYLVGIGDAAIYREKMTDGSDAVAFASAVYHARGMNLIAVLNLIMAAALAVLIALKIAEIISFTIAAVATVICAVPYGQWACPIATTTTNIYNNLHNTIIPNVQKAVDAILKASSESQRWVARITPWVGAARGVIVANQYSPTVKGGAAVSVSMMPMGDRLGLPVQEEPFDKLCERAGKMIGDLAFGWIPGMSLVGGLLGKLTGTFPGYFCGDSGGSGTPSQADLEQNAKDQCTEAKKQYEEATKNNSGPKKTFQYDKCVKDTMEKLKGMSSSQMSTTGSKTSKMIYGSAHNGDDYFQVYGLVLGDNEAMHQNAKKRVEMPAWGKATVDNDQVTDALEKVGFAEAEFYYDQVKSGKLAWDKYKDDALWNMRWRARLRRFRLPTQISLGQLSGAIGSIPGAPTSATSALDSLASAINGAVGFAVVH